MNSCIVYGGACTVVLVIALMAWMLCRSRSASVGCRTPMVIQTWKSASLPSDVRRDQQKLVASLRGGDMSYAFFDDSDVDHFVYTHYPECAATFQGLPLRIQQIDLFRYLAVYHFGGLYYDMDMEVERAFDQYSSTACVFPVEFEKSSDALLHEQGEMRLLGNYAFCAPRGHPFLWRIVENIINQRIPERKIPNDPVKRVLYTTGPVLVTQTYLDYVREDPARLADVRLLQTVPFRSNRFGVYARHRCRGQWKRHIQRDLKERRSSSDP